MASFRRAQSPAYNKYQYNGGSSTSSSLKSLGMFFIRLFLRFLLCFSRFLAWVLFQRYPPKKGNFFTWKWSLKRFLICFTFGFVIGLIPFISPFDDITTSKDFSFEIKQQQLSTRAQMDLNNVVRRENAVLENLILETKPEVEDDKLSFFSPRKQLIIVTPTYNRAMQAYFLNRLSQVLRLVPPPVLWIVVEMSKESIETSKILRKTGVMYRHLVCMKNSTNVKDRGVHQRNTALEHIEHHKLDGIVYFADDDNVYALALFESLREISRFGTWPVAMLAPSKNKAILEGPVCNGSQVIGWHTNEKSKKLRRFHVDMSGFAFNSTILWNPKRWHRPTSDSIRQLDTVKEGFQETTFIEQIVEDESQMEPIPYQCLRIMNWHLHLEGRNFVYPRGWHLQKNLVTVVPLH